MKANETREKLIEGTVRVIAREGFDKTTTKLISKETGINEAYIYRCFEDKEDLFAKTFTKLDKELIDEILLRVSVMYTEGMEAKSKCWLLFSYVWRFLLGNREKCTSFLRYYYSPYFKKYSFEEHKKNYEQVVKEFAPAFKEGVNVWIILNHILDIILAGAIKVFNGEVPDDVENAATVFDLVYSSVESRLAWTV